jgi:hypothetical protein
MEMNFPHPRRNAKAWQGKPDYDVLVATATSRQATSQTVSALLAGHRTSDEGSSIIAGRMAFFGRHGTAHARGAFLPSVDDKPAQVHKFESAVNRADSTNGKPIQLDSVKPELQVAERGTEF